jgi:hypothetical protein
MDGGEEGEYRILVRTSEGKKPLEKPRYRWEDNIKIDLKRDWTGWCGLIWLRIGTSGGLL